MVVHILNLRREMQVEFFEFQIQNGLRGEFKNSQESREKLCLRETEECRKKNQEEGVK